MYECTNVNKRICFSTQQRFLFLQFLLAAAKSLLLHWTDNYSSDFANLGAASLDSTNDHYVYMFQMPWSGELGEEGQHIHGPLSLKVGGTGHSRSSWRLRL